MDNDHSHEEIRRIAYGLWTEAGQPAGQDREHWEAAKEIWAFRNREEPAEPQQQQSASLPGDNAASQRRGRRSAPS